MRIGQIIGNVTLSRLHPSIAGGSWRVVVPLTAAGINGDVSGRGEPFVLFDELGAGIGSLVAISEGAEAAAPFHPDEKPLDAYNAAILDTIEVASDTREE